MLILGDDKDVKAQEQRQFNSRSTPDTAHPTEPEGSGLSQRFQNMSMNVNAANVYAATPEDLPPAYDYATAPSSSGARGVHPGPAGGIGSAPVVAYR